jgi:FtsP/CotA-like multicopper oxidase with cupredoxin domain
MSGLVVGIRVREGRAATVPSRGVTARRLRLLVSERARTFAEETGTGYALQAEREPARDSIVIPGPALRLTRGEPVAITVVNRATVATSVHWHGIELESYFDGVPWFSGAGSAVTKSIAPGDSFVARFTPPRAGTFIYHTHFDEVAQLSTGLYGALIVEDRNAPSRVESERIFVLGVAGTGATAPVVLNNRTRPDTVHLVADSSYLFRFIDIAPGDDAQLTLARPDSTPLTWTPVAKDGATLPASRRVAQDARLHIAPGETYDFSFTAPAPGRYRLLIASFSDFEAVVQVR